MIVALRSYAQHAAHHAADESRNKVMQLEVLSNRETHHRVELHRLVVGDGSCDTDHVYEHREALLHHVDMNLQPTEVGAEHEPSPR